MAFKSWRLPIRLAALLLAAMMLAVLLVAATLAWMVASESGTRATFALLRLGSGGMIEARGIQGRLIGPLQIDALRIDLPASATQAATLPASLRLPLPFRIDPIKIAHLRIQKQGKDILEADSFSGRLEFDGQRYRADLQNVQLIRIAGKPVSGKLTGSLTLAADAPFSIAAELRIRAQSQSGQQAWQADGTLHVQGALAAMDAQWNVQLSRGKSGMTANGKLALQPFSPSVIRQADLHASDINLALLDPAWPFTCMTLRARLEPGGQGKVSIKNTGAGTLDQHRLPVSQADLQVRFTDQAIWLTALDVNNGVLQGSGQLANASAELHLTLHGLNLRQVDTRLRETRLTGDIKLKRTGNQDVQLRLSLTEPWQRIPLKLEAEAAINEKQAAISTARLQHGKACASLSASLEFNGARRFAVEGKFLRLHLQDFGQIPGWPEIMLNGHAEASGNLASKPQATIFFSLADSRIDDHALHGNGKFMLSSRQLLIPHLQLALGDNLLKAQGALQETGGDLQFSLHAPQLAQLGPHFGGTLQLEGRVTGSIGTPLLSMNGQAQHLMLPGATSIEALALQLQAGVENNAPLVLQLDASHVASGKLHALGLRLQSAGTIAQHQLTASLTTDKQHLMIEARGSVSLKEGKSWQGQLTKAATSGNFSAQLEKPASLFLSVQRQQIDVLNITSDYGQLNLQSFRRDATGITSHGTLAQCQPAAFLSLFGQSVLQSGDLRLNGAWDLQLPSHDQTPWQGTLSLQRTTGDVVLRSKQAIALGMQNLALTLSAKDNRIHAAITANGKQLGQLAFAGSARTAADHSLLPDLHAPLAGELSLQLPAIDWIASLFSPDLIAQGSVSSTLAISGSWSAPQFKGQLHAQQLRLMLINSGIDLRHGVLDGEFTDSTLEIRQLQFAGSSGNGTVSATGPLRFQDNTLAAKLAWRADGFSVFNRTDRKLVVSGNGQFSMMNAQAALTGNVLVDSGFIDIGREETPRLSDDVIMAGQPPADSRKLALDMNVVVGLGQQLVVKGRGLDAHLGGAVQFASKAGSALTARGLMQVTRGTYKAYGRELAIERGVLRFDGAPGNPALDIRAMRRGMEVEAGVIVGGTALAPRVALVSEPQVPDAEKLSWLVLGQGLSNASGNDLGALQGAATALLSQGAAAGVQTQLATAFGLDSISLSNSQDSLQQRIITLGKRLSSRLYVSYQQGLQSAGSAVLLRYTLSPRLTVEAETGTRSVFSLFYNMRFD